MHNILKIFLLALLLSIQSAFALTTPTTPTKQEAPIVETTVEVNQSGIAKFESNAKGYYSRTKESLEAFRNKQSVHFALLRDQTKVKLGIKVSEDVFKGLAPIFSPPPAPEPIPGTIEGDGITPAKIDNPMDYGTLIFATAMASLFSSIWMFYGVLFLVVFIMLRALFKMF